MTAQAKRTPEQAIEAARLAHLASLERQRAERRRAKSLPHPDKLPPLTPGQARDLRDLERAEALLAEAKQQRSPKAKRRGLEALIATISRRVEAARKDQLDRVYAAEAVAETVGLAVARGEEVAEVETEVSDWARDEHGAMIRARGKPTLKTEKARAARMVSRSGFAAAWERGALDGAKVSGDRLYELGKKYRRAVERVEGRRTPNRDAPKVDCGEARNEQDRDLQAEAAADLAWMRAGLTSRERLVLDMVCGLDHSVRATEGVLRMDRRTVTVALRSGLVRAGFDLMWWGAEDAGLGADLVPARRRGPAS